ncbi:glycogen synthase GlgA [Rhodanobacter aciditrophus]|uniref:glycogen synthase GlgA n=1 Tax=Rhodanobacter aciditrophus TaxID=1623218 RepID=UPI003CF5AC35
MRAIHDKMSAGTTMARTAAPKVLFVASEIFPLAKTGGLADVCGALPQALAGRGIDVRMLMPGYTEALDRVVAAQVIADLGEILPGAPARIVSGWMPDSGLPVWLVDCPPLYRRRGSLYRDANGCDWPDNGLRFAVLNHAAARIASSGHVAGWCPDIVHAHDWHAGLLPLLLHRRGGERPKTVFTVHNMAFQGLFPLHEARALGLPPYAATLDGAEFYGRLSFLKAGIRFADVVTTVSRNYAREIGTPEFGCGMDGLIRARRGAVGIMNGIDEHVWNPATDDYLEQRYSRDNMLGKHACKVALQRQLGLDVDPAAPLAESVCRLTHQKMADVLLARLPDLLQRHPHLQMVVHGCGDAALEQGFTAMAAAFPGRMAAHIGYDESLAHRLHAGADILLHGARFEPCGLTQLYAMRYGAIPVVRRVGGLADSVIDVDVAGGEAAGFIGFVFDAPTGEALGAAVERCLAVYEGAPQTWVRFRRSAMSGDYGWQRSAAEYARVYAGVAPSLQGWDEVLEGYRDDALARAAS